MTAASLLAEAVLYTEPLQHGGARPYDAAGNHVLERGDTQDGGYIGPCDATDPTELGLFQPYSVGTTLAFVVDDNAVMDTTDVDTFVIFKTHVGGVATQVLTAKSNATSNRFEWIFRLKAFGNQVEFLASDTGSGSFGIGRSADFSLAEGTWYAMRCTYDESAGTVVFQRYNVADSLAQIASGGGLNEIVANLTPEASASPAAQTPITMFNGTAKYCVGAFTSGASDTGATQEWMGVIRYATTIFDGGTVTFDPEVDATAGSTSFDDDTDSGLTWTLQTVSSQTDWPTYSAPDLGFDGGDWLATSYTPSFTPTAGELTIFVATTPGSGSTDGDRILSSESATDNGCQLEIDTGETVVNGSVGGASSSVSVASGANFVAATRFSGGFVVDDGTLATYDRTGGLTATSSITGVGTITHSPIQIGARTHDDGVPYNGDIQAIVIIERALLESELDELSDYFLNAQPAELTVTATLSATATGDAVATPSALTVTATVDATGTADVTPTPAAITVTSTLSASAVGGATASPTALTITATVEATATAVDVFYVYTTPTRTVGPFPRVENPVGQLHRFFGDHAEGISVIKESGTWTQVTTAAQDRIDAAQDFLLGGHEHLISATTQVELIADGVGGSFVDA